MLQLPMARSSGPLLGASTPISGLLPASTAKTPPGNYGDAWVPHCVTPFNASGAALAHRRLNGAASGCLSWEQGVLMLDARPAGWRCCARATRWSASKQPSTAGDATTPNSTTFAVRPVVADDAGTASAARMPRRAILPQLAQLTKGRLGLVQSHHERGFSGRTWCFTWPGPYRVADLLASRERGAQGATMASRSATASSIGRCVKERPLEAHRWARRSYGPHVDGSCCLPHPPAAGDAPAPRPSRPCCAPGRRRARRVDLVPAYR